MEIKSHSPKHETNNLQLEAYRTLIRPPQEIARAIVLRAVNHPSSVCGLPHGRFRLPPVETDAPTLALIAHAAHLRGWTIERFMLDAAVAAAQEERDRAKKRVGVRITPGEPKGDITRRGDQNLELRVTQGIHGIAVLTAIEEENDDGSKPR